MKEPAAGGQSKLQAAKQALADVVQQLPPDVEVGARVFGAEVFSRKDPGACTDTQNVVPVGPLDREALTQAVAGYRAYGETPVGRALQGAAKDLGPASPGVARTIVLLSDGEATCRPDPCTVAKRLSARGLDLTVNVVGLDVSGAAREALRCIARAGNGTYYDARSADELATSLVKVSVRDLRGFVLTGERVQGGTSLEKALPLDPGAYVDTSRGNKKLRYYLLDKPPGGGVSVSALVRPPKGGDAWHTALTVELLTPAGDRCTYSLEQSFQVLGGTPITSAGVEVNQFTRTYTDDCESASQLVATVRVDAGVTDYRLQVDSHPKIVNAGSLPKAVAGDNEPWVANVRVPRRGATTPVAGGVSPDDAPELLPGTTYTDTLLASEQTVYKIPVEYGQAVRVSALLGRDARADAALGVQGNPTSLTLLTSLGSLLPEAYEPDRGVDGGGFYNGAEPHLMTAAAPPVRARNASVSTRRSPRARATGSCTRFWAWACSTATALTSSRHRSGYVPSSSATRAALRSTPTRRRTPTPRTRRAPVRPRAPAPASTRATRRQTRRRSPRSPPAAPFPGWPSAARCWPWPCWPAWRWRFGPAEGPADTPSRGAGR